MNMLSTNAHLVKRNGATHEVISERNTTLKVSELVECILTFWECSWGFVGKDGEMVIQVWEKIEDRSNKDNPVYEFILTNI